MSQKISRESKWMSQKNSHEGKWMSQKISREGNSAPSLGVTTSIRSINQSQAVLKTDPYVSTIKCKLQLEQTPG